MSVLTAPSAPSPGSDGPPPGRGKPDAGPRHSRIRRTGASTGQPAVNLLSPWVLEELRVHRLRARFALGALVLVVLVGASWGLLQLNLSRAEQSLEDERGLASQLEGQIGELGDVRAYVGEVTVRTTDVEETMSQEVALSKVLRELEAALPPGAAYDGLSVSLPPAAIASPGSTAEVLACPGPDPFAVRPVVGCVTLSGTAGSRDDVSRLVQALAGSRLFVEPFVNTTTTSGGDETGAAATVQFIGSLGLDPRTLTGRYADIDGSEAAEGPDGQGTGSTPDAAGTTEGSEG